MINGINNRFDILNTRLTNIEEQQEAINNTMNLRLDNINNRFDTRLTNIERAINDNINRRLDNIDQHLEQANQYLEQVDYRLHDDQNLNNNLLRLILLGLLVSAISELAISFRRR